MTWGITPVEFAAPSSDDFPDFLQWQADGENLGGTDASTVNVTGGLTATRGVGEDADVITLTGDVGPIQWQADGVDLGDPNVTTVNLTDGLLVERTLDTVTISVDVTPHRLSWRVVDGDGTVTIDDIDNGISMTANTGAPVLTVPAGVIPAGAAVLVLQKGAAQVDIVPSSGLGIVYPSDRFVTSLAGQGAIVTLLGGPSDSEVVLCGDMASVTL